MGSAADLGYSTALELKAEEIGYEVAKKNCILFFGAEKDGMSLSTAACKGAKKAGGFTVGVTYGKGLKTFDDEYSDVIIATGLERGGGREMSLVLSCDAIIALSGGSGTLTEIAIAYQGGIPIVVLEKTGGWSEKLENTFLDGRNRLKIVTAKTPKDAVDLAIKLATK